VIVVVMLAFFLPVVAMVVGSFQAGISSETTGWWTNFVKPHITGAAYSAAASQVHILSSVVSSVAVSVPTTVLTALLSVAAAYTFVRSRFPLRVALSLVLIALIVMPPQAIFVPLLSFFRITGVLGSVPSLWAVQVGLTIPFGVFLLRGFVAAIPEEVYEAAAMDGANTLRIFRSIVLPIAAPGIAALGIIQFLWSWNDLLDPLVFLAGSGFTSPATVEVAGLAQVYDQPPSVGMAAATVSIIIPIALLIGLQRYFVRGMLAGSVKG